jgi:type I restriction-modification system DNA methylase subunit
MPLNWNEIKHRAVEFSHEWEGAFSEDADAKPFLVAFFNVFGLNQRKVATFEHKVKKLDNGDGYIDMLWKGQILIEMKSKGKDLGKAYGQAKGYLHGLKQIEIPKYVLVCDFDRFRLYDLEEKGDDEFHEFTLKDLVHNVEHFGFIAGYQKKIYREEDPVNIKAAELMGKLHDRLKEIGYEGHPLEVYLVRVLFLLFAEDTTIFEKQQFQDYIEQRTSEDGSDLAAKLQELFQVLNTPLDKRFKNLDEQLAAFPYVNGKLFEEILPTAFFDASMRDSLLECCYLDWSKISPAIFGSMFQSVMDPKERRNLGAHYTSEKNILKLIKPLFLDDLKAEFEKCKNNTAQLRDFHFRMSKLKFLDPACGCGNFLVITYRELRLLELEVLRHLHKNNQVAIDLQAVALLDVDMMNGIEIEEFPARIAEVAMWLIDHQMNMLMSMEFGQYYARLPLKKSANIVHADSLEYDWQDVAPKESLSFIIGNPPFIGSKLMTQFQRDQIKKLFSNTNGSGVLDYVSGWYIKASKLIQQTKTKVAFVSTNSITQGEQVGILWRILLDNYNITIHFAHRTFKWSNEARSNAAVHVVIIGFAQFESKRKFIYEYKDVKGDYEVLFAENINPYLLNSKNILISKRSKPICGAPIMQKGSQPTDNGNYLFSNQEKIDFINKCPQSIDFFRRFIGSDEFINNKYRWCLWLKDISPSLLQKIPMIYSRVENVRQYRLLSTKLGTRKKANTPTLFDEIRQPTCNYLAIPEISSERRKYIPIGIVSKDVIASNKIQVIDNYSHYIFGILSSLTHNIWIKNVCGRLESRIIYSSSIVYNNFPWPENPSESQIQKIEQAAQKVLDARAIFPESSLAVLYDPLTMPPELVKAHQELDKAVDLAYRPQPFPSEAKRMEFLFELYEKYTANLFTKEKVKKSAKKGTGKAKE